MSSSKVLNVLSYTETPRKKLKHDTSDRVILYSTNVEYWKTRSLFLFVTKGIQETYNDRRRSENTEKKTTIPSTKTGRNSHILGFFVRLGCTRDKLELNIFVRSTKTN